MWEFNVRLTEHFKPIFIETGKKIDARCILKYIYQFDAHKIDLFSDDEQPVENPHSAMSSDLRSKTRIERVYERDVLTRQMWLYV